MTCSRHARFDVDQQHDRLVRGFRSREPEQRASIGVLRKKIWVTGKIWGVVLSISFHRDVKFKGVVSCKAAPYGYIIFSSQGSA